MRIIGAIILAVVVAACAPYQATFEDAFPGAPNNAALDALDARIEGLEDHEALEALQPLIVAGDPRAIAWSASVYMADNEFGFQDCDKAWSTMLRALNATDSWPASEEMKNRARWWIRQVAFYPDVSLKSYCPDESFSRYQATIAETWTRAPDRYIHGLAYAAKERTKRFGAPHITLGEGLASVFAIPRGGIPDNEKRRGSLTYADAWAGAPGNELLDRAENLVLNKGDAAAAIVILERLAERGDPRSMALMAFFHGGGAIVGPQDCEEAWRQMNAAFRATFAWDAAPNLQEQARGVNTINVGRATAHGRRGSWG